MRGEIIGKDFKSIVTGLAESRNGINLAYKLIKDRHH